MDSDSDADEEADADADSDSDADEAVNTESASSAEDADAARNYPSGEDWCGLTWESSLELLYAEQFTVDYYEGGFTRIVIADEDVYLLLPESGTEDTADDGTGGTVEDTADTDTVSSEDSTDTDAVLENLPDDVVVLQRPIENIYLVATSAMDFFVSLDALDSIRLSGTNADGWYIEEAQEAMEAGNILYAGKYNAPDYELILSENCGLAIESTMIYHNPEVQEKLETFGIPVLVERSSYETHPMGRTEWIKLYAVLLGLEDEAEELFDEQVANVQAIESEESLGKTVAFFYITSAGTANVHKSNDYVAKMIELAGGTYVFADLGEDDSATSTVNMTMEEFYAGACDADYIIYNSTIDGELYTMDELLGKSALLADFTAVQNGNVWCTGKNLFQETTSLGDLIVEIHTILIDENADESELEFLHRIVSE
ncbi:MAG: ABC transporter substrate-binding protein [Lachnospiraceae bacterium]|nr:ABC transporter substrate-binding protein [Lachnospiraceae bacterium]